jgi:hypothetical protein
VAAARTDVDGRVGERLGDLRRRRVPRIPRSTAAAPATCGAAADVPENNAQPSLALVPSGGSPAPPPLPAAARSTSIGQPAGIGSMM